MMKVSQNIVVVSVTVLTALIVMAGLNRIWPREKRWGYNDLIGWQLSILGTTYAVILGFMLYAVWTSLGEANLNVDFEANAVVDVYHLAAGLPQPQRSQLQQLARDYVETAISQEWPQMGRGETPQESTTIDQGMWNIIMSVKPASPTEVNAQEQSISELESLTRRRLTRIRQSKTRLPGMLWWVLLVGGGLTILTSCTLGSDNVKLQSLEVFCFALLVSLSLVTIANIHRPFRGMIHVTDYAFHEARQSMQSR